MGEVRRDFDLTDKTLGSEGSGQIGPQNFHCDLAVVLDVIGEVDGGHPARTEFPLDGVAVESREVIPVM